MPIKLTIDKINSRLAKTNFRCIEEYYRNPNLKMTFRCSEGHLFKVTWSYIQKYIGSSTQCPLCKHGEDYFLSDIDIEKINKANEYFYKDRNGRIFKTQKAYREHNRKVRASANPHEMAIESLCNKIPHSKKYGFRKEVIEAFIKWETISIMRENKIISQNETPDRTFLKKEMTTPYCTVCEDRAENCDCEEEMTPLYDLLSQTYINDIRKAINFVPDLFAIDEENRKITAFEVEDTHRTPISKLVKYAYFKEEADWYIPEWEFELIVCDRFGNEMGCINLSVYYFAEIADDFYENYMTCLEEVEKKAPRIEKELMGYYRSAPF